MRDRLRAAGVAAAAILALLALLALPAPAARGQVPRTIALEVPRPGRGVGNPVEVRGRVTVSPFENNLRGRVYDRAGQVVGEGPVAVTPDDPQRFGGPGSFAGRIPVTPGVTGTVRVEVADVSVRDGSVLASASADVFLGVPGLPATGTGLPEGVGPAAAFLALGLLAFDTWRRRRGRATPRGSR